MLSAPSCLFPLEKGLAKSSRWFLQGLGAELAYERKRANSMSAELILQVHELRIIGTIYGGLVQVGEWRHRAS